MANVNINKTSTRDKMGFKLNSTQDDYYNGYMQQENGKGSEEAVDVVNSTEGKYLGLCSQQYGYTSEALDRIGQVDIEPHIRRGVTITGATTVADKGKPVYASSGTALTTTFASGLKFVGIVWWYDDALALLDIGFLNRVSVSLAGGNALNEIVYNGLAAGLTASTALNIPFKAKSDCVIKTVTVTNTVVLSGGTDFTFTFKKNNTGSVLTIDDGRIDTVTQDAVHTITFATPVVLKRGDYLNFYVGTIGAAATTGSVLVEAIGYNV